MQFLTLVSAAIKNLGFRRGVPLLVAVVAMTMLLTTSMYLFNKPARTVLYAGLSPDDVSQIGMVLSESGIAFDVNEAGTAVLVEYGKTPQARMLLAEKGLPKSDKSGYQLFDQMGSLGLTSFMQQITRVRALEGELVRTIQQLDGIRTARVHLALKPDNSFKTKEDKPTASVVIRTFGRPSEQTVRSIKRIVAAAVPSMLPDSVLVMTTDGSLPDTGNDASSESDKLQVLERSVSADTQERVERTLSPIAGMSNVRVSVTTMLNTDKRQIQETNFDPDSKVERSIRTTKSSDQSSDNANAQGVSVDQNIPQEVKPSGSGDQSTKKKESKEETVNYEVNSKQTATVSDGYKIEKQSLAVVVNRQALVKLLGGQADEKKLADQIAEIEAVVKSSAGFDEKRGDTVHVTAVDFAPDDATLEPVAGPGLMEILKGNTGTLINAFALILSVILVLLLGLKPALKFLTDVGSAPSAPPMLPPGQGDSQGAGSQLGSHANQNLGAAIGNLSAPAPDGPRERLNRVVGGDINKSAQVIKQWLATNADAKS